MNKEEKRLKEVKAIEEQNRARGIEDFPKSKKLKTISSMSAILWPTPDPIT